MESIDVRYTKLVEWAELPVYDTRGAAGCDLSVCIREEIILYPHEITTLPTGIAVKIPDGFEAQIRSRAGMARKGIIVANAPGTIDAEHNEEIRIILVNITGKPVKITPNQKVAQMVFSPVVRAVFNEA